MPKRKTPKRKTLSLGGGLLNWFGIGKKKTDPSSLQTQHLSSQSKDPSLQPSIQPSLQQTKGGRPSWTPPGTPPSHRFRKFETKKFRRRTKRHSRRRRSK